MITVHRPKATADNSVDAIVSDPSRPVWTRAVSWPFALRVLKPGGHLVARSRGSSHRMTCAIEDAGFEIRDALAYVRADRLELICLARKPLSESTVAANVLKWGTGALNIGACRIENSEFDPSKVQRQQSGRVTWGDGASGFNAAHEQLTYNANGRWPANVIHDGSEEVITRFPETTSGALHPYTEKHVNRTSFGFDREKTFEQEANGGSAARFFHCAPRDADLTSWLIRLVAPPNGVVMRTRMV